MRTTRLRFPACLATLSVVFSAQGVESGPQISPPNWWANMGASTLQLMVHAPDIAGSTVSVGDSTFKIDKVSSLDSKNYLFIDVDTSDLMPGDYALTFSKQGKQLYSALYTIEKRAHNSANRQGFNQKDTIYLVTPDRFANGDPSNDSVSGLQDKANRSAPGGRHGGDIQGLIDQLDYISSTGFTQIWSMPLLENAMDDHSYHGYAITDFYEIDPRYGTNSQYRQFSHQAGDEGVGIIMDMVLNHIGSNHPWMEDMPAKNWINHDGQFSPTTHRRESLHDPHGVQADQQAFSDGWFVPSMPDLNQRNPYLANYLIQNAIWWVEYANLSGIRVDTYSYSDKAFLSDWTARLTSEYPNLNIVGEEWTTNPVITAYWQAGSYRADNYASSLPSVMDFPLQDTLVNALKDKETWGTGLVSLYNLLAGDFIYGDPYNLVIFGDNHDMSRIYTQLEESYPLWDMAMTFLLTSRGIPQVYYGTEILMANPDSDDHGIIRSDFPGGWQGDKVNAFTQKGLSDEQRQAYNRIKSLLALRKDHPVVATGKFTHFAPADGIYVYFRTNDAGEGAMVILNKNNEVASVALSRFEPVLKRFSTAVGWQDKQSLSVKNAKVDVAPQSATVWLLQ
ncbi:glycoside hydrolase family 13 protein [Salinimonas sp. HHU 13199]|uniref:Glycoside hydrolase family 13 protein n=1 Tax=Salinimonas profundi TaxID=2729140 RepID=A0ABR8LHJ9_9ALTE|nr:glycoside hydrolase family 13 protein [Salinimonas profundi]MBD3584571.1 glycoside hydrolase family 13 protein [Salinimonas profundi]